MFLLTGITVMGQKDEMKSRQHALKDLSAEQIATLQTKKMTLALDLNEAQQAKMKSLLTSNAQERKEKIAMHKELKEDEQKMTSEERYTLQNERLDKKISHKKEMKALLTEVQYSKWEKMQYKKGKHQRGKSKERKKIRK